MLDEDSELPPSLRDLLKRGRWPTTSDHRTRLRFEPEIVRSIAPDESEVCLSSPPFPNMGRLANPWLERFRHPGEIDYDRAVIIGDFGPGSDNPIVLDLASTPPRVMALSFTSTPNPSRGKTPWPDGASHVIEGHWTVLAPTFDEFAERLGLG